MQSQALCTNSHGCCNMRAPCICDSNPRFFIFMGKVVHLHLSHSIGVISPPSRIARCLYLLDRVNLHLCALYITLQNRARHASYPWKCTRPLTLGPSLALGCSLGLHSACDLSTTNLMEQVEGHTSLHPARYSMYPEP